MNRGNLLDSRNGRFLTFGLLYVFEGIPYGFTSIGMVVLNNVFCATQDVAIDSLAVSALQADERGRANGAMFVSGTFGFEAALAGVAGLRLVNLLFVVMFVRAVAHSRSWMRCSPCWSSWSFRCWRPDEAARDVPSLWSRQAV